MAIELCDGTAADADGIFALVNEVSTVAANCTVVPLAHRVTALHCAHCAWVRGAAAAAGRQWCARAGPARLGNDAPVDAFGA